MTTAEDVNALVTFPWLYGTTAERQRFTAFFATDQGMAVCGRDDSASTLLERIANELATTDQFGSHEIVLVDRDSSPADLYRLRVAVSADGRVKHSETYIGPVLWCPACESMGHTVQQCGVEECDGPEPETMAESLGLRGMGGR